MDNDLLTWLDSHLVVILLLFAYLGAMIYHAWRGNRATKNITDFYIGGRNMGGVAIGISFVATYASTNAFVGIAGQAYDYGSRWLFIGVFAVFFTIVAWHLVAPRLRQFTEILGSVTIPDFIGFRFNSTGSRLLAGLIVIGASVLYLTAIFKGAGHLLSAALDISYVVSIWVIFIVVVAYTAAGGFISVVKTDVVQGLLMGVAAIVLIWGVSNLAGGVFTIVQLVDSQNSSTEAWTDNEISLPVLFGIFTAMTIKLIVEPRQLSRFYALKNEKATRQGKWISIVGVFILFLMLAPIGLYARIIFPDGGIAPDLIVPTLLGSGQYFHPGIGAFIIVAMTAAAMSSIDSVLLVTASTCERDVVHLIRCPKSDVAALRVTRISVVLFALAATVIALDPPGTIISITALSGSIYAVCFIPAVIIGLFWRKGNGYAVSGSILSGIAMLIIASITDAFGSVHAIFPATIVSSAIYIGISVATSATCPTSLATRFWAR